MTRDDWLACGDPATMLNFLRDTATDRKLRLFACAWGRDVWRHLSDERSRDAILTAERFADGAATFADLLAAHRAAADAVREIPLVSNHRRAGISRRQADHNWGAKEVAEVARRAADPTWDARTATRAVAWNRGASRYALSSHLRDIFNPFRSAIFDPAWLTSTVLAMSHYTYDSGDFSAMPILADALQDAGCEDEEILTHCRGESAPVSFDVRSDHRGEFFEVALRPDADAEIEPLDVRPADRHLLLLVREDRIKSKFLCGHDERHWFVAAIPESASVGTIAQAMEALKPAEVRDAQSRLGLRAGERNRRRNAAFVRQGEWFFLPIANFSVEESRVRHWEPIRRGWGSKPHMAEWCYRSGGETVYVCERYPNGLLQPQHRRVLRTEPGARGWNWRVMMRNAGVYVRGRVRHADHATIALVGWHRVVMNTEGEAAAMRQVAFLD